MIIFKGYRKMVHCPVSLEKHSGNFFLVFSSDIRQPTFFNALPCMAKKISKSSVGGVDTCHFCLKNY